MRGVKAVPSAVPCFWHRFCVLGAISPHTWGGTARRICLNSPSQLAAIEEMRLSQNFSSALLCFLV